MFSEPVCQEFAGDWDFDKLVYHHWRQHFRGLPVEVTENKLWKSDY